MQKLKTLNGIMRAKSNQDLMSSSQVSIMTQKTRSFGSLRTKRIISLQRFGISVRSLAENFQPSKRLYGQNSRLSQTSFGHPFNQAKINSQPRVRESAENFGIKPKLSEKNSRGEVTRLLSGWQQPQILRQIFLENSSLTTSYPMVVCQYMTLKNLMWSDQFSVC